MCSRSGSSSNSRQSTSRQKALSDMEKVVQRKKENDVDSSPAKSSKGIGVVLKKDILIKASTSKDNNIPQITPKPMTKSNLSLISCEYGSSSSNDEDDT